jgi:hypothetical protein
MSCSPPSAIPLRACSTHKMCGPQPNQQSKTASSKHDGICCVTPNVLYWHREVSIGTPVPLTHLPVLTPSADWQPQTPKHTRVCSAQRNESCMVANTSQLSSCEDIPQLHVCCCCTYEEGWQQPCRLVLVTSTRVGCARDSRHLQAADSTTSTTATHPQNCNIIIIIIIRKGPLSPHNAIGFLPLAPRPARAAPSAALTHTPGLLSHGDT